MQGMQDALSLRSSLIQVDRYKSGMGVGDSNGIAGLGAVGGGTGGGGGGGGGRVVGSPYGNSDEPGVVADVLDQSAVQLSTQPYPKEVKGWSFAHLNRHHLVDFLLAGWIAAVIVGLIVIIVVFAKG
jgi:hypothetical protein